MSRPIPVCAFPGVSGNRLEYAQVRIQARLSHWPAESDWGTLAPLNSFALYLEGARKTPMTSWLEGIRPDQDVHVLESTLRHRMLQEVDTLARWSPEEMQWVLRWCRFLPYLPFLTYLGRREPVQPWMRKDLFLAGLLDTERDTVADALLGEGAELLVGGAADKPASTRWLEVLCARMPRTEEDAETGAYTGLLRALRSVLETHPGSVDEQGRAVAARVHERLVRIIHLHSNSRVILPAYLGLMAWNLDRLHAELVSRRLFEDREGFS